MSKKILIITGAGASKSLTSSLKDQDQISLMAHGEFQEMPTGDMLIKQISTYQNKSAIWVMAYICFNIINKNIDDKFVKFGQLIEDIKDFDDEIHKEAFEKYNDGSKYDEYEKFIMSKRNARKVELKKRIDQIIMHSNQNDFSKLNVSKILNNINFFKLIIDNLGNDDITYFDFSGYANEIFYYLIYYALALDLNAFNKIKHLLDIKYSELLSLFFSSMFNEIKNIIHCFSNYRTGLFSKSLGQGYNNPRRFQKHTVIGNSVYKDRKTAYENAVYTSLEQLKKYKCKNDISDIIKILKEVLANLTKFKVGLQEVININPLLQATFEINPFPDCGQTQSMTEYIDLFNIKQIDEPYLKHDITNSTILDVTICIDILTEISDKLRKIVKVNNEVYEHLNLTISILLKYGFKSEIKVNRNILISSVKTLFDTINVFIYKHFFNVIDLTNNTIIEDMKGCYISSSVVSHYQPLSIDYFMMNFISIAPYEFEGEPDDDEYNKLRKYTKYIIANILMGKLQYVYHGMDEDNYLKRIQWKLIEYSHFYNKKFEDFLFESVDIINFNYELSLMLMLLDFASLNIVTKFFKNNVSSVYGSLFIENKAHEDQRYMFSPNDIWLALFKINPKEFSLSENLNQLEERIKWIGESRQTESKSRSNLQKKFKKADEIYFLGFGFDINNLYNLGIIDKKNKLDQNLVKYINKKRIFIAGGNTKIISTIKNVFGELEQDIINDMFHLKNKNLDIYISQKLLPKAFDDF